MAGEMVDFSTLSFPEKLGILWRGRELQKKYPQQEAAHAPAPERNKYEFRAKPQIYGLPRARIDRNPTDAALNYSGGYDFASQPGVSIEDAIDMAKAYQLRDYMMAMSKERELDAQRDFAENVAGIVSTKDPKGYLQMMRDAANYGKNVERYAKGGLITMKESNCGR